MAGKSTYLQNKLLNWLKGTAMGSSPTALYVGLFTADPTDAGTLTNEVTTTIRPAGRVAATFGSVSTAGGSGSMANSASVGFGSAEGVPGGAVTHFAIFDAVSAGNMLYSAALDTPRTITLGADVSFAIGAMVIGES